MRVFARPSAAPRPVTTPAYAVAQSAAHQILVCKACKQGPDPRARGGALITRLRAALAEAGLDAAYEVAGTACLAGCVPDQGGACVLGWRAPGKATWLFGKIDPAGPVDDLVAFSRLYAAVADGWLAGRDCPPRLCDTTLARIPAAVMRAETGRAR
ncbi:DUF1636 domain-containing protein [Pseudorhodobacter sp. MZDSW-24AT]|uniref:DUF1636 family protein n=1 Tax=Pseudorhodobacter sp. MZDSW-24AT TaxID=2052957 RepID=UPI000C1EF136|nr:DUF1636 domain-containing protein [Pseudorhodobacter sp. MZDSW-24AT]PJF11246.1 hypothetical protein CUR21_01200 [Pseudorhodobacter sp. MZDSW-24AT]